MEEVIEKIFRLNHIGYQLIMFSYMIINIYYKFYDINDYKYFKIVIHHSRML